MDAPSSVYKFCPNLWLTLDETRVGQTARSLAKDKRTKLRFKLLPSRQNPTKSTVYSNK